MSGAHNEQKGEPEKSAPKEVPRKVAKVLPLWEHTESEEEAMLNAVDLIPGEATVTEEELNDADVQEDIIRGFR